MPPRLPHRPRRLRRLVQPLQEFTRTEAAGGIVLLFAALVALGWGNSPWADAYHALIEMPLRTFAAKVKQYGIDVRALKD